MRNLFVIALLIHCFCMADAAEIDPVFRQTLNRRYEFPGQKGESAIISCLKLWGNAAYMYVNSDADITLLVNQVATYNAGAGAGHQLQTIFLFGGEVSFKNVTADFVPNRFLEKTAQALATANISGLTVHPNIDANLPEGGSPILQLSTLELYQLATKISEFVCSNPLFSGIHLDLEPFSGPYITPLLFLLEHIAEHMRGSLTGCTNAAYPIGRAISVYSSNPSWQLFSVLGANGAVVWPAYDLTEGPVSVAQYTEALQSNLTRMLEIVKQVPAEQSARFSIAVPASATQTEYMYMVSGGVNLTQTMSGKQQFSLTEDSYITMAVRTVQQLVKGSDGFIGMVLWKLTSGYTVASDGSRLGPAGAFDVSGEQQWLQQNL
ncbi:hypothetical protein BC936DRAFT_149004 [Jimgerdemannia flammicorona]|uniref:Uncharacterized protein n=2 Tax=Jimgerdemannia flammicorona TaxID=994334 RepID=A0A433QJD8_9FUNG|nr:hypothetical protein BC936DRAFT_149004 [Jimgerdemannia flammicorona]RUS29876.1 hypothetical protein BC938DRAFT_480122 [Jimgerdemannia flammicorona]